VTEHPVFRAGGVSYLPVPAPEPQRSADFDEAATFRDPAGNVVGAWQQGPR
jgi:hypothetical protein